MTIEETRFTFYSDSDRLMLSALRVEPEKAKDVKGIVQLVHGMCEPRCIMVFEPSITENERKEKPKGWKKAINMLL